MSVSSVSMNLSFSESITISTSPSSFPVFKNFTLNVSLIVSGQYDCVVCLTGAISGWSNIPSAISIVTMIPMKLRTASDDTLNFIILGFSEDL